MHSYGRLAKWQHGEYRAACFWNQLILQLYERSSSDSERAQLLGHIPLLDEYVEAEMWRVARDEAAPTVQ